MTIILVLAMIMSLGATFVPNVSAGDPTVTGTVKSAVDPFGPIQGVKVMYAGDSGVFINTTTNLQGEFTILVAGGPMENFNLTFTSDGYQDRTVAIDTSVYVGDLAETNVTGLTPLPKIVGTVKDLGTNEPLADAVVTIDGDNIVTGTDGTFTKFVVAGTYDIFYKKDGYYNFENRSVVVNDDTDVGTIYLEMVVPTPTKTVWGIVTDVDSGVLLQGVDVAISSGDGKWISSMTDINGRYEMLAYPGNFEVRATFTGYETYESPNNDWLEVPSDKDAVRRDIQLTQIPSEDYSVTGTVNDGGAPLANAIVKFIRTDGKYEKSVVTDGAGGFNMAYNGTFKVYVEMDGYFPLVLPWDIDNTNDTDVIPNVDLDMTQITEDRKLFGFVGGTDIDNILAGAEITLYDKDNLHVMKTTSANNGYYEFMVHDGGSFAMIVDIDGYQSKAVSLDNIVADTNQEVWLDPSATDTVTYTYTFDNWTHITAVEEWVLVVDNVSKRAELDRKYGMGALGLTLNDWVLSDAEVNTNTESWKNFLIGKGIEQRDTSSFLTVNDVFYNLDEASFDVAITDAVTPTGIMADDGTIMVTKTYEYEAAGSIDFEPSMMVLDAKYDEAYTDYIYNIVLPLTPDQYELTDNETETTSVTVTGYNDPVEINPGTGTGTEAVTLYFAKSLSGEAVADIEDGLFFQILNETGALTGYIVSAPQSGVNTSVVFTAEGSTDPVGDIEMAHFAWDFENDGVVDASGMVVEHNFTTAGDMTVNLTIMETGGNITEVFLPVFVDNLAPKAVLSVNDSEENVTDDGTTITVEEDNPLVFNGMGSYDDINTANDKEGVIESWFWVWGDDTANTTVTSDEDNNVTHAYETPGTFTLQLFVTDVMGHESVAATRQVEVADITAPTIPDITMVNDTMVDAIGGIEDKTYYFGANETTDNFDVFDDLNFTWIFEFRGDETTLFGPWVQFTFTQIGDYNITLSGVDTAGNVKNFTKVINARVGDRPDLRVDISTWKFNPKDGSVGSKVTITVNITNIGNADATNVDVKFYVRNADGTDEELSGTLSLLDSNGTAMAGTTIKAGETVTAQFEWTPGTKGTYTLWVNASTPDEHTSQWENNKNTNYEFSTISVSEAGWVVYAIIGGGIAILVLLYFGIKYFMGMRAGGDVGRGDKKKKK